MLPFVLCDPEDELFQLSYLTGYYCPEKTLVSSIYLVAFPSAILFLVDLTTEQKYFYYSIHFICM